MRPTPSSRVEVLLRRRSQIGLIANPAYAQTTDSQMDAQNRADLAHLHGLALFAQRIRQFERALIRHQMFHHDRLAHIFGNGLDQCATLLVLPTHHGVGENGPVPHT